jgi:hypothetical protein
MSFWQKFEWLSTCNEFFLPITMLLESLTLFYCSPVHFSSSLESTRQHERIETVAPMRALLLHRY